MMARLPSNNPSPDAVRQREYRERRRQGVELERVALDETLLAALEVYDPKFDAMDRDHPDYRERRQQALQSLLREVAREWLRDTERS